jgi:LysM repeat protein
MLRKSLIPTLFFAAALLAALIPLQVRAGGVCGGAYTIENGDTVEKLAAMCGTTASAIYAANPGLKEPLTAGQVITIPGANYGVPTTAVATVSPTPVTVTPTPSAAVVNNYYTYNTYNYYNLIPEMILNGTYTVQPGDTFAGIAYSFGVSINDLWAANPTITDINTIYAGQVLYIPFWSSPFTPIAPVASVEPSPLNYAGTIPNNAPRGTVRLVNKTGGEVYVSLRTTRADGTNAINEYPVSGTVVTDIPVGWIDYVAWVGGNKFTGGFKLSEDSIHTVTFNRSKVVVD